MSRAAFVLLMGLCATGEGIAGVQVAFTPGDAQTLVLDTLNRAQSQIDLVAYSFTSEPVVASAYQQEFERLWEEGGTITANLLR